MLERFADAVEDGLAGADDLQPATRKRMQEMLDRSTWTRDCLVGPCLEEVRAQDPDVPIGQLSLTPDSTMAAADAGFDALRRGRDRTFQERSTSSR